LEGHQLINFKATLENLLDIKYPVLLGGMARISDPLLASAVSEAGGLEILACALETGDTISAQIKKMRELVKHKSPVVITSVGSPEAAI
jgi:enoyl-[acyl-carrier protein] reductase II